MRIAALRAHPHDRSAGLPATTFVRVVIGIAVGDTVDLALANANRRAPRPHAVGCEERRESHGTVSPLVDREHNSPPANAQSTPERGDERAIETWQSAFR
jgi:hypothetical protein